MSTLPPSAPAAANPNPNRQASAELGSSREAGHQPGASRAYLASLVEDVLVGHLDQQFVPLVANKAFGPIEALDAVMQADRLAIVGRPGSGKTTLLKVAARRLALAHNQGEGTGRIGVYVDLATARDGEGIDELIARRLAAAAGSPTPASLAPALLLVDNLDRASDVYLLEGIELLMRAGGRVGPAVVLACREAEWPAYGSWFGDVPAAMLQPLSPLAVEEDLHQRLRADLAATAGHWLARDRSLASLVRLPLAYQAFVTVLRDRPSERWRRSQVLESVLDALLAAVPNLERRAYRLALADVALGGLGGGPLIQVDTVAMGLGASRDQLVRSGAVVARGAALQFIDPLVAQHCAASALAERATSRPEALLDALGRLPEATRHSTLIHVYSLVEEPVRFLAALLAQPRGAELAAACLAEPDAADPAGPSGVVSVVEGLCRADPAVPTPTLYRLGEALARAGESEAAKLALGEALARTGPEVEIADVFERPDVDLPPPIQEWLEAFIRERNRGLALAGLAEHGAAEAAFAGAGGALDQLQGDLAFEEGLLAADEGEFETACAQFEKALAVGPDRGRYLFHYGRALLALDRAADAVTALERARDGSSGSSEVEAALGDAYRAQDWVEEALASYEEARRHAPQAIEYEATIGELKAELGDLDGAAASLAQAVAARPGVAAWHDALGQVNTDLARHEAAAAAFAEAFAIEPTAAHARRLGQSRLKLGQPAEAVAVLRRAVELAPNDAGVLADLARALTAAGEGAEALGVLQLAVRLDPGWPDDHRLLAQLLREAGRLPEALEHAQEAVLQAPTSGAANYELGQVHDARGEYREALAAYDRASAADPGEREYLTRAAAVRRELGDHTGVMRTLQSLAQLEPQNPSALDQLARHYESAGDAARALDALSQATALAPRSKDYPARAGRLCLALGQLDEAVHYFSLAAGAAPDDAEAQRELAMALRRQGDEERAIGVLRRASRLAPKDAEVLLDLADAARALGRTNEARATVDRALTVAPNSASVFAAKAQMELAIGDPGAACEALRQAVVLAPEVSEYRLRLADLVRPADSAGARALLEALLDHGDPEAEVHLRLAQMHAATGAWDRAVEAYAEADAARGDMPPAQIAAHAAALRQAGRPDEALAILESAVKAHNEPVLWAQLAHGYEAVGRERDALDAYGKAGGATGAGTVSTPTPSLYGAHPDTAAPSKRPEDGAPGSPSTGGATPESALDADDCLRWSRLAGRLGEYDLAIEAAHRAVALVPYSATAFGALADAFAAGGLGESSLMAVRRATELAPKEPVWHLRHARIARELGRSDETISVLEEGIAECPDAAELHFELGQAYAAHGWLVEACSVLERASRLSPSNSVYARALALAIARDNPAAAVDTLRQAVGASPHDSEAAFELGRLLQQQGDLESAAVQLRRAARLVPSEPAYQRALGECLAALGHPEALEALKKAVALEPHLAAHHAVLAAAYAEAGRHVAALDSYATAARLAPREAEYQRALGILRLAREDYAGAEEALAAAIRLDPSDRESQAALARAMAGLGRHTEASGLLGAALEQPTVEVEADVEAGRQKLAAGDASGALLALERAFGHAPENSALLHLLVQAACAAGRANDARRYAETLTRLAPEEAPSWQALAAAERAARHFEAALAAMDRALGLKPNDAALMIALAELAEEAGDFARARSAYQDALAGSPTSGLVAVRFAELAALADWRLAPVVPHPAPRPAGEVLDDCEARLDRMVKSGGRLGQRAALALALLRGRAGDGPGAVMMAQLAVDQAAKLGARLAGNQDHSTQGDSGTLDHQPSASARAGTVPPCHVVLAWSQLTSHDPDAALETLSLARAYGIDGPEVHWLIGRAHEARGEYALASVAYRQVVARVPDVPEARAALEAALAHLADRQAPTGETHPGVRVPPPSEASAEPSPNDGGEAQPPPILEHGNAQNSYQDDSASDASQSPAEAWHGHSTQADIAESDGAVPDSDGAEDPTRSATLTAGDSALHRELGLAAYGRGQAADAAAHLEMAARLGDSMPATYLALGDVYRNQGALDDAIQAVEHAASCAPGELEPLLKLGAFCAEAGLTDKAVAAFERAAAHAGADTRPVEALARLLVERGEPRRALAALEPVLGNGGAGSSELFMAAGAAHKQMRRYGQAAEMFRHALRLAPANPAAYSQLAAVLAMHLTGRSAQEAADA